MKGTGEEEGDDEDCEGEVHVWVDVFDVRVAWYQRERKKAASEGHHQKNGKDGKTRRQEKNYRKETRKDEEG